MKRKTLIALIIVSVLAATGLAGERKSTANKAEPATKVAAKSSPSKSKVVKPLSGDLTYRANCTRCHVEPRRFSERKTATILRHMRVRGNLTEEEAEAILRFLTQ